MGERIFGLPQLPEERFNQLMTERHGADAPQWRDLDANGKMEPHELQIKGGGMEKYSTLKVVFTPLFIEEYKVLVEIERQLHVAREKSLTYIEDIKTDLPQELRGRVDATSEEIEAYKEGVAALVRFAGIQKRKYQYQVGFDDAQQREFTTSEDVTPDDRELVGRYGHPYCIGDQGPFCMAIPSLPDRGSGVLLGGATCADLETDASTGSPFTVVSRDGGDVRVIPYATHFRELNEEGIVYLDQAIEAFLKIQRESELVDHLIALKGALRSTALFPFLESDTAWHALLASKSAFLIRTGSDEVGGDGVGDRCEAKARAHFRLGLVNVEAGRIAGRYGDDELQGWEREFTALINDPSIYREQEVVMSLPVFYDVIYETGDDVGGANGTTIGQSLPNWCGEDGTLEPCPRAVMIFVNKTLRAYSQPIMMKYIVGPLLNPKHHGDFDVEVVALESVVLHEIAHNFGPQMGSKKLGTETTYADLLKQYRLVMEEMKAQTGSMYLAGVNLDKVRREHAAGRISDAELASAERHYRSHVIYDLSWALRMILRATRGGRFEGSSYSKLAAIQIGMLQELGALTYDPEMESWTINFEGDKFKTALREMMAKVLQIYARGDFDEVEALVKRYTEGEGFPLLHHERIAEVAGDMPSFLPRYEISY